MFDHDICLIGRLDTFSTFSAFKMHNSVSLLVKIMKKTNSIGRPSWCFARKQSSNSATGCDVINRWIIGIRDKYQAAAVPGAIGVVGPPLIQLYLHSNFFEPWFILGSVYVPGKLPTYPVYPSPKSTFCPKWKVSVNVGLGEGYPALNNPAQHVCVTTWTCREITSINNTRSDTRGRQFLEGCIWPCCWRGLPFFAKCTGVRNSLCSVATCGQMNWK